jgi:glycosyltransferase involved in cell wall biosynthesis
MKCSVIIPCYNQVGYLPVAVDSVLNQTYGNLEVIIVIDGSPDNSYEVACAFAEKSALVRVYKKENGGLSSARNYGIERATGEIILPLDADDKIAPTYIEKAMRFFEEANEELIVYCDAAFFGDKQGPWKLNPYSKNELCMRNVIFCSAFFRKSSWKKAGGYDINMKYGLEDWEFWISLIENGCEVVKIEEELFFYYKKPNSMIAKLTTQNSDYSHNYIWQKHRAFISAHIPNPLLLIYENKYLKAELNALQQTRAFKLMKLIRGFRAMLKRPFR